MADLSISVDDHDARRLRVRGDASGSELRVVHDAAVAALERSPSELIIDVNGVTAFGAGFVDLLTDLAKRAAGLRRRVVLEVPDGSNDWVSPPISPAILIERTSTAGPVWTTVAPKPVETATANGAPRREGAGYVTSYGPGRRCAANGCTTTLSRYNSDPMCWIHSPATGSRRG